MWSDVLCVYRGAQWVPFGHTVFLDVFFSGFTIGVQQLHPAFIQRPFG